MENVLFEDMVSNTYGVVAIRYGIQRSNITLVNISFINTVSERGPAITYFSGNPIWGALFMHIQNCSFINNYGVYGGAIDYSNSEGLHINIVDSLFLGNLAGIPNVGGFGGAIYAADQSAFMIIKNTRFDSNSASSRGGAICSDALTNITIINSTFFNNTAFHGGHLHFMPPISITYQRQDSGISEDITKVLQIYGSIRRWIGNNRWRICEDWKRADWDLDKCNSEGKIS